MKASSTWLEGISEGNAYPPLEGDAKADVAIVGGGIAGSVAAYMLAKEGKKVVLVDKGTLGGSTTAYTTAMVTHLLDTAFSDQCDMYGKDKAQAIWLSGKQAVSAVERIVKEEGIDCEFSRVPLWVYSVSKQGLRALKGECEAGQALGFDLSFHEKPLPGLSVAGYMEMPNQGKFHPLKFVEGVRQAATKHGAMIFEGTEATALEGDSPVMVVTKSGNIEAEYAYVATYQPLGNPKELFGHKGMYVSYMIEISLPKGTLREGLYLDDGNPYHYFRIDAFADRDRMVVGGSDHRKEIPVPRENSYRAIEEHVRKILPGVRYEVVRKWSGDVLENVDGLPMVGRYSKKHPHRLVATGFSGNGMHTSAIAAGIVRDIVAGRPNPDIELYDAGRKLSLYSLMKKFKDFGGEFFGGAVRNIFK